MIPASEIKMEYLTAAQAEVAELIGLEAYQKLVAVFGGERVWIPKVDSIMRDKIPEAVRNAYDGSNHTALARRFGITVREVDRIIKSGGD